MNTSQLIYEVVEDEQTIRGCIVLSDVTLYSIKNQSGLQTFVVSKSGGEALKLNAYSILPADSKFIPQLLSFKLDQWQWRS